MIVAPRPADGFQGGVRNTEAERVLIEEVRDAVADLVELIKTYQSKNKLSQLLTSTLFKRRQEELDAIVDSTILHLQVSGLQSSAVGRPRSFAHTVPKRGSSSLTGGLAYGGMIDERRIFAVSAYCSIDP